MSHIDLLRDAARKLEIYELAKKWVAENGKNNDFGDLRVVWHGASACIGFKEIQLAISARVREAISELMMLSIEDLELEARKACGNAGVKWND